MHVSASPEARKLVAERGRRLYVWTRRGKCCGAGLVTVETAAEPPAGLSFRSAGAGPFEVLVDDRLAHLPDRLEVDVVGRFKPRLEAYWNGCAYVI